MARQAEIEIPQSVSQKPGLLLYPAWILVTFLAVPVAFVITLAILRVIIGFAGDIIYVNEVRHITEDYLFMYIFVPVVGLVTGGLQYSLLRQYLPRMGWWVFATTGGWLLGMLLVVIPGWLGWTDAFLKNLDLILVAMGLATGAAQWSLLRRRLPRAAWWVAASLAGWSLLALVTPGNTLDQYGLITLGAVPACATAAALALLLKQGPQVERTPEA
jgi:hypothetical protein